MLLINTTVHYTPSNPLISTHSHLRNLLFCAAAHHLTLSLNQPQSHMLWGSVGLATPDLQVGCIADGEISGMERRVLGF